MATARQYSVLQNLVATICQDLSANGLFQAGVGINTIIKEINREFKMPNFFKGWDNSVTVIPIVGTGVQTLPLASDLVSLSNVWWVDNAQTNWQLIEIPGDMDWNEMTDQDSTGDPVVYRYFTTSTTYSSPQLQIWTAPNQGWVQKSTGLLYYSYWAQFGQLVNPADIPNIPYELDTILVNGGVVEMARMQGDDVLLEIYQPKYEDDLGSIRAWLIKRKTQDGQMQPDQPSGVFGRGTGARGYSIGGGDGAGN